ncbi:MAG TPA: ATP-binding protein [Candidatus Limnocylindrales bacterium]|nr:ATP-binding protein [Candidatus Limnocylindrales bacterium]
MSNLIWRVEQRQPAAIVSLTGPPDAIVRDDFHDVLWECLAGMPTVLLLEVSELDEGGCAALAWVRELSSQAAKWPGVPVYVCGDAARRCSLPGYGSLDDARDVWDEAEPEERHSLSLRPVPQAPADAREFVAKVCHAWGIKRPVRLAQILISELVSNAVVHARAGLDVTVRRFGEGIELSVRDDGLAKLPAHLPPDPRGFGLQLVEAMSDAWGSAPTGSGKVVWARLMA